MSQHDAFICYSRKNEAFASMLEKTAENYKPPKSLPVPQKYLDLFRDKQDFAAGDYYENRDKHLNNSAKLIAICSPDARKSKYVNDEIRQFLQSKPGGDVIPILFAGIPNNEVKPGQEDQMAFPQALCDAMPMPLGINYLGFDVKRDKINKAPFLESWYALLAAIYDLSRAEVEQRERRRTLRKRRITYSVLGGSIVVLATLLILVWISRNEAVDRKLAAEAAQLDAQASQMFAESRRVDAQRDLELEQLSQLQENYSRTDSGIVNFADTFELRKTNLAYEIDLTKKEIRALEALGKQYRTRGKAFLDTADKKWLVLREERKSWAENRLRPAVPVLLSMELLNASDQGKCMILHYGDMDDPKFLILGGGIRKNFKNVLAPRLQEIREKWMRGGTLPVEIVIASETDMQSIEGLVAMTDSLLEERRLKKQNFLHIKKLWYNSFKPEPARWLRARLAINATELGSIQNKPFDHFVMRPDSGAVSINEGLLKITVIHPYWKRLEALKKDWRSKAGRMMDSPLQEDTTVEKFRSKDLTIIKGPAVPLDSSVFSGHKDRSVVNLASLCLVFEVSNKRILFTGDAVGDDVLRGLHAAGMLSPKGTVHVDVLVLPHSASDRNVSRDFFERVTADNYILFGDGTHDNPEVTTLRMLEEARSGIPITMFFVNRDGRNNHGTVLDQYFIDANSVFPQHRRVFRRENEQSLIVNLWEPLRY